mgnify:FL=1
MTDTDFALLDNMLTDMSAADPLYQPTSFWQSASDLLVEEVREHGIECFKSLPLPLRFFVPNFAFPDYYRNPETYAGVREALKGARGKPDRLLLRLESMMSGREQAMADYRVFLAGDTDAPPYLDRVSESDLGEPAEQFEFDGRRFSRAFLNYLLGLNFIKRHCDIGSLGVVMEIGGGHGGLGEIVLGDERNNGFYLDVDIPPTAFFATWYLQQVFGEETIADYNHLRDRETLSIEELQRSHRGAVICPWQLPRLQGPVDLFVNFVSFQEMEPPVVKNYLAHVQRLGPELVLLRNLREGKQVARNPGDIGVRDPILGSDYDDFLDQYVLVASNVLPYGHLTEDGFHSELKLYRRR